MAYEIAKHLTKDKYNILFAVVGPMLILNHQVISMSRILFSIIFLLLFLTGHSQKGNDSFDSIQQNEKTIKSIKQIVLCKCVQNGYPKDSLLQKDPSFFIISDIELNTFGFTEFSDSLAKAYINSLPAYRPGKQSESMEVNPILLRCIQFYQGQKLDQAVRKRVRNFYSK
jgi:hypothetical protein